MANETKQIVDLLTSFINYIDVIKDDINQLKEATFY